MTEQKEPVGCKDCKHAFKSTYQNSAIFEDDIREDLFCAKTKETQPDWLEGTCTLYQKCRIENRHGDCQNFEPKLLKRLRQIIRRG